MPGKRVQFDDQTWQAIALLASDERSIFKPWRLKLFATSCESVEGRPI